MEEYPENKREQRHSSDQTSLILVAKLKLEDQQIEQVHDEHSKRDPNPECNSDDEAESGEEEDGDGVEHEDADYPDEEEAEYVAFEDIADP